MSLRQLRTLEAIVERGSFAAAAKALFLTQSSVGMQMAALETALGTKLFDRAHRPPRLTAAGQIVYRRAKGVLAQYDGIFDALAAAGPYRGTFRLGAIPTVLTNLLPAALVKLRDQEPELTINVVSGLSGLLLRQVERGELDAALMHKPEVLKPFFSWRDIAEQRIVVVAPPDSVEQTAVDTINAHPYIRFNRTAWVAPLIEQRLKALDSTPKTRAEIQSIEAIHIMIRLGFGFSILPDFGESHEGDRALRILDFGTPPIHRTIGLLSRQDSAMLTAGQLVGDAFVEVARGQSSI